MAMVEFGVKTFSDEVEVIMKNIHRLIRECPKMRVEPSGPYDMSEKDTLSFGYIGNLSRGYDDRRWMVWDNTKAYTKDKKKEIYFWNGNRDTAIWACDPANLTPEKLKKAFLLISNRIAELV